MRRAILTFLACVGLGLAIQSMAILTGYIPSSVAVRTTKDGRGVYLDTRDDAKVRASVALIIGLALVVFGAWPRRRPPAPAS